MSFPVWRALTLKPTHTPHCDRAYTRSRTSLLLGRHSPMIHAVFWSVVHRSADAPSRGHPGRNGRHSVLLTEPRVSVTSPQIGFGYITPATLPLLVLSKIAPPSSLQQHPLRGYLRRIATTRYPLVPPSSYLTTSTVYSAAGLRVYCTPHPIMGFAPFHAFTLPGYACSPSKVFPVRSALTDQRSPRF